MEIIQYNSHKAKEFRLSMSHYPSKKCSPCDLPCTGGCPLFWYVFEPDEIITEPVIMKNA